MTSKPDHDVTSVSVWLVRHGETGWSKGGRHTGRTDVVLTETGKQQARRLARVLLHHPFSLILSSPMGRALETARLAGFSDRVEADPDLGEWDYGAYEGISTVEIRRTVPDWTIWTHPVPDGEAIDAVSIRADRAIERARAAEGDVLLFGHGHLLRVLAARWIGLDPTNGRRFALGTATVSVLGWERETPVIERWNVRLGPD